MYPESAVSDWEQRLRELHVPAVISPLHDKDLDEGGKGKKAHRHVLLKYDGLQRYEHVRQISQDLLHGTIPQKVESERSIVRYFIHADQPEKHQYDHSDILTLNSANVDKWFDDSGNSDVFYALLEFVRDNGITEIADLYDVVDDNRDDPEFKKWREYLAINHHAQAIDRYLRSRRYGQATSISTQKGQAK